MLTHADYLNVSLPPPASDRLGDAIPPGLISVLDGCCSRQVPTPDLLSWTADSGMAQVKRKRGSFLLSLSGAILGRLRAALLLDAALQSLESLGDVRITRLHVAYDERRDPRPVLRRLYRRGTSGAMTLGRKRLDKSEVKRMVRASLYGGDDTGSVMLRDSSARVSAIVYDKRNEQLDRYARDIGHELTRTELRLGSVGLCLADVAEPDSVFFHYAAPELVKRPPGVPDWKARPLPPPRSQRPPRSPEDVMALHAECRRSMQSLLVAHVQLYPAASAFGDDLLVRTVVERLGALRALQASPVGQLDLAEAPALSPPPGAVH